MDWDDTHASPTPCKLSLTMRSIRSNLAIMKAFFDSWWNEARIKQLTEALQVDASTGNETKSEQESI